MAKAVGCVFSDSSSNGMSSHRHGFRGCVDASKW